MLHLDTVGYSFLIRNHKSHIDRLVDHLYVPWIVATIPTAFSAYRNCCKIRKKICTFVIVILIHLQCIYFMYLYIIFQMSYIYVYIYVTSDLPSLIYILCTLFFRWAKALNITSKLTCIFKFLMYFIFRIAVSLFVTSNLTAYLYF